MNADFLDGCVTSPVSRSISAKGHAPVSTRPTNRSLSVAARLLHDIVFRVVHNLAQKGENGGCLGRAIGVASVIPVC